MRMVIARCSVSYAGRLDPMAEGVMLCLVGSANKRREEYLDLPKEYVVDIMFGFSTDTYDILGRVMETGEATKLNRKIVEKGLNEFRGSVSQEYPPFSSKTVEGKSLFEWARSGTIGALVLPRRTVTIKELDVTALYKISEPMLLNYIEKSVDKVDGDFRQEEILSTWHRNLKKGGDRQFKCATVRVDCSSGTYVRSIAQGLVLALGCPALALPILRTTVGADRFRKSHK